MPSTIGYSDDPKELRGEEAKRLVRHARERLEWGKRYRTQKRETVWKQAERQYEGNHWVTHDTSQDPTADLITVNVSFSTVNTMVPYVTGSDPRFMVEPYSMDATVRNARAQAAWLNRFWRLPESGSRRGVALAAMEHFIYGDGYGKVTYAIDDSDGSDRARLFVDRVSPWDVWLDPLSSGKHDARWMAQRIRTTKKELENDGTYANLDKLEVGLDELHEDADDIHLRTPVQGDPKEGDQWVEIFEFYDLIDRTLVVFGNADLPLKVVRDMECPLVPLENHYLPRSPYHMGDLEQIWPMQQELNKTRSQMMTHRRRNVSKVLVSADFIDPEAEAALSNGVMNAMVKIRGDRPLNDVTNFVVPPPLSADLYNTSDVTMRDIFEVTGVNEYLRGATPTIRRTATEASIIEGASNVKSAHKLQKVEEFVRDLAGLVLKIAADVFPTTDYDEMQIFLTGRDAEALNRADLGERLGSLLEQGADQALLQAEAEGSDLYGGAVLTPGPEIWQGVYQVEVLANSTELRNPIFKEQKYRQMAQFMVEASPMLSQLGVNLNLKKIFELWFEAAGIQDIDAMFADGGPAPQQPMQAGPPQQAPGGALGGLLPGQPNTDGASAPSPELLTALATGAFPPETQG